MLAPFFVLAGVSPTRQAALRNAAVAHVVLTFALCVAAARAPADANLSFVGNVLLTAAIVEGALMIGWRLTQLPKSQALEFLLVSPVQPDRVFFAEAAVGLTLLAVVTLAGLPALATMAVLGCLTATDVVVLLLFPYVFGALTGIGLAAWAYEPKLFRRAGEFLMLLMVLGYLVIGVMAGENLRSWIERLPPAYAETLLASIVVVFEYNPFGVVKFYMESPNAASLTRAFAIGKFGVVAVIVAAWRASRRLKGHYHERHYDPVRDVTEDSRPPVGNSPLSWWAVKRVTEYSGRINLYLAGGFCLLYGAYLLAGEDWPAWLGRRIFEMTDSGGGASLLGAALILLAAVPAAFQYGLWDSGVQERCKRLELLLLTDLRPVDYWNAALSAAWVRGRGYVFVAAGLWLAAFAGGKLSLAGLVLSALAGALVWALYFALGFRAFARGVQANGLGMLLTVGLPLATFVLYRVGLPALAELTPPGLLYAAGSGTPSLASALSAVALAGLTLYVGRESLGNADAALRAWYDRHHGSKVMT